MKLDNETMIWIDKVDFKRIEVSKSITSSKKIILKIGSELTIWFKDIVDFRIFMNKLQSDYNTKIK